jgi:hypothetical protein
LVNSGPSTYSCLTWWPPATIKLERIWTQVLQKAGLFTPEASLN